MIHVTRMFAVIHARRRVGMMVASRLILIVPMIAMSGENKATSGGEQGAGGQYDQNKSHRLCSFNVCLPRRIRRSPLTFTFFEWNHHGVNTP
jgi:hypothetical protein